MTAPDHSRKRQIPLAPRAPSIHGTQRHSPRPPGASPLLGVERSYFVWAQPGHISAAPDPELTSPAAAIAAQQSPAPSAAADLVSPRRVPAGDPTQSVVAMVCP